MMRKISNRIIVSYSLLIVILVFFLLLFFNDLVRDTHMAIIQQEMEGKIKFIELVLRDKTRVSGFGPALNSEFLKKVADITGLRITIINLDGEVRADSEVENVNGMDNHQYRREVKESIQTGSNL